MKTREYLGRTYSWCISGWHNTWQDQTALFQPKPAAPLPQTGKKEQKKATNLIQR